MSVQYCVRRLNLFDRTTWLGFYIPGHSPSEMARDFAAPLGTIKRRLRAARKRLAQQIDALSVT